MTDDAQPSSTEHPSTDTTEGSHNEGPGNIERLVDLLQQVLSPEVAVVVQTEPAAPDFVDLRKVVVDDGSVHIVQTIPPSSDDERWDPENAAERIYLAFERKRFRARMRGVYDTDPTPQVEHAIDTLRRGGLLVEARPRSYDYVVQDSTEGVAVTVRAYQMPDFAEMVVNDVTAEESIDLREALASVTAVLDLLTERGFITFGEDGGLDRSKAEGVISNARSVLAEYGYPGE